MPFDNFNSENINLNIETVDNLKRIQLEYDAQINNLKLSLENKDNFIQSLSNEKVSLNTKIAQLEDQLNIKKTDLSNLVIEKEAAISSYESKLEQYKTVIEQKDESIRELQTKLSDQMSTSGANAQLISDNQKLKLDNELLNKNLLSTQQNLVDKLTDLTSLQQKLNTEQQEKTFYKDLYLKLQQENISHKQALEVLNKKIQASFEPSEMANYLTNTIDAFNKQVNISDSDANYIISDMDVELKANVAKNESNQMLLAAPSLAVDSDKAISTIKFTIRAVPKNDSL